MEWIETTGSNIGEATGKALERLGVRESDAQVEVIAQEKLGLFGRVRTEARVRARVRPATARPKLDRGRRPRTPGAATGSRRHTDELGGSEEQSSGDLPGPPVRESPKARRSAGGSDTSGQPVGQAQGGRHLHRRSPSATGQHGVSEQGKVGIMEDEVPVDRQVAVSRVFLEGLLSEMGYGNTVAVETHVVEGNEDGMVELEILGAGLGPLVGARGETLAAVQDLARTVVQRRTGARRAAIQVDVAHYRARRRSALQAFARGVAEEVLVSGRARVLEPMASADRKAVHDALSDVPGVGSSSEGEEPTRRVVIRPAV